MSSDSSKVHPLFAVPDAAPEEVSTPDRATARAAAEEAEQAVVCQFCFGTGMEVVEGRGARRCRCRTKNSQAKLLEAARIPRRYDQCSLQNYFPSQGKYYTNQGNAFRYAYTL